MKCPTCKVNVEFNKVFRAEDAYRDGNGSHDHLIYTHQGYCPEGHFVAKQTYVTCWCGWPKKK